MGLKAALLFATCASLLLLSQFYRSSNAIIAPILASDLKLTPNDLGLLGGAFFYAFGIIQIPMGMLMDRIGPRVTMIALNSAGVAGAVLFAGSNSLPLAVAGRALIGIGMAANLMGPLKIFTKWFARNRFATISGSLLSVASLGSIAATSPLAVMVNVFGWRGSFYVLSVVNALLIVCTAAFVHDRPPELESDKEVVVTRVLDPVPSLKSLFSSWSYWAISASVFLRYGAFASIQSLWAGPFLIGLVGLHPIAAGNVLLLLNLGFILGSPVGGMVSDRVLKSRRKAVCLAYSISACATLGLAFHQGSGPLALLVVIFFVIGFSNAFNQISFAHIRELMPERISGSAMTAINFFLMTGAGVFTHLLGFILENTSGGEGAGSYYKRAFLICFGAFALASALYLTVREAKPKISRTKVQ